MASALFKLLKRSRLVNLKKFTTAGEDEASRLSLEAVKAKRSKEIDQMKNVVSKVSEVASDVVVPEGKKAMYYKHLQAILKHLEGYLATEHEVLSSLIDLNEQELDYTQYSAILLHIYEMITEDKFTIPDTQEERVQFYNENIKDVDFPTYPGRLKQTLSNIPDTAYQKSINYGKQADRQISLEKAKESKSNLAKTIQKIIQKVERKVPDDSIPAGQESFTLSISSKDIKTRCKMASAK